MMKTALAKLSPAETEILRIVWQLSEATVQQVADNLPSDRNITYATVQTLLRRLEKKGYVSHKIRGKAHVFLPAVKRKDVIRKSVGDFIDRLFGGDPLPLMQYLAEHRKISSQDLDNLKKLINKK